MKAPPPPSLVNNNTKHTLPPNSEHAQPTRCGPPPPSLSKSNTTCTSRLNLDHVRPPRDHSQVFFDRDGGGAGIWPAVCRPTRHHDGHPAAIAHWFSTRMVGGQHVFRCVLSRARAHLAHSGRAPNAARLARLEHAAHLAHVEHVAHLAHQTCLARLGPRGPWRTCRAWHAWRTSPQRRAHGVAAGSQ